MLTRYTAAINSANDELKNMREEDSDKKVMLKEAIELINNLGGYYNKASHQGKVRLLGSIFPEMIEFDGIKCRTPKINQAILLCLNADKGLQKNKSWKPHEKLEVSSWVEPEGFEPSSKQ